ncbi:MAG: hypothetical protein QOK19_1974 [Solirubrobacteraceae bacterium]|nr:hypothetical protein [Solirubrobacteraceae bacterium]
MQCRRCGLESPEGMSFCGRCGTPLGEPVALTGIDPEGGDAQRRQLTVLFCDLVGSTALAERLDPEDFREALSGYHEACAIGVQRYDGYVAQYQGDGAIAYFGYPRAHEDDARRAVQAGLEVLDEIERLNGRLGEQLDLSLVARVGLHTGVAVTGELGSGAARERHSAVGEVLHVAARVQALAPPGTVAVTAETFALVRGHFDARPLGARELKGISRPVQVHVIRPPGPAGSASEFHPESPGLAAPMVDRTEELERLRQAWGRAAHRDGTIVHVSGDAGIGKSRLVESIRSHVSGEAGAVRVLRCSPDHAHTPLHPVVQVLERLAGLDRSEAAEAQLARLEGWLQSRGVDAREATPLLADLLSIAPGAGGGETMMPRDARNLLLGLIERLLVGDTDSYPLLLVGEDLHWADPTTIELLERIVARVAGLPVVAVFTFRRDYRPAWARWVEVSEIELGPLDSQDVRELAAISAAQLDEAALLRVETAAEGVPLFVEEMVKLLSDDSNGGSRKEVVPATLQGLLAERLDRLPQLSGVIDLAAVLGREFEGDLLAALSALDRRDFRSAVAQLTAEEVLRPVEGSGFRLEFRHALLQEAAYARVLRRRRRLLHGRVAELLGSGATPGWRAHPEMIALHWSSAEEPGKALDYWELAGRRALKSASFLEASEHFRRAVEALDETDPAPARDLERGELLTHRGAALQAGRTPAADVRGIYDRAAEAYSRAGGEKHMVPVIRGRFLLHNARAEYEPALNVAREMLAAGRAGHEAWLAEGHFYLGFTQMLRGELGPARAELEACIRSPAASESPDYIHEAHPDPAVGARAYLSTLLWHVGCTDQAFAVSDESLELAEQAGGPVTLALARGMRCALLLLAGRGAELGGWLESTRVFCVERNIGYWSDVCSMWSTWLAGLAGEDRNAHRTLESKLELYLDSGGRVGVPHFYALLAEARLAAGEELLAREAVEAAQAHIDEVGERFYEPEVQRLTGRVLMAGANRDPAAAAAAFERAIRSAHDQGARLLELRSAIALARHQRALGEPCASIGTVASLCEWFGADSTIPDVVRARATLVASGEHPH